MNTHILTYYLVLDKTGNVCFILVTTFKKKQCTEFNGLKMKINTNILTFKKMVTHCCCCTGVSGSHEEVGGILGNTGQEEIKYINKTE